MASKKQKQKEGGELLENPEVLAEELSRIEEFLERNKTLTIGITVLIVLVIGGFFGFRYYKTNLEQEAQTEMFQAVRYFEQDSLDLALNGDGNNLGLVDIVQEYGITGAANLANYYAGLAHLKKGNFELAILYLEDFKSHDLLVQARSYSLIGDAHMELGDYGQAAEFYDKAANYKPNKYFTPTYLMKAALAHEKLNNVDEAKSAYQRVIEEFWDSGEVQNAKKFKAKLEKAS